MGRITMSAKEVQRPGLVRAAQSGKITNLEGAAALGISVRQFRRLRRRFEAAGVPALLHQGRGRPSGRRLPETIRARVAKLLVGRYAGFNDCHLAEILREQEGLALSRASVQRIRTELGLEPKRKRRAPRHRRRREREARPGALVLVDASEHRWCEDRCDSFALLGAIDDATGTILGLVARPHEDLHGYASLLRHMIRTHGVPASLYGDRTNIFVRNDTHWTLEEELAGEFLLESPVGVVSDEDIGPIAVEGGRNPVSADHVSEQGGVAMQILMRPCDEPEDRSRGVVDRTQEGKGIASILAPAVLACVHENQCTRPRLTLPPSAVPRRASFALGLQAQFGANALHRGAGERKPLLLAEYLGKVAVVESSVAAHEELRDACANRLRQTSSRRTSPALVEESGNPRRLKPTPQTAELPHADPQCRRPLQIRDLPALCGPY